MNEEYHNSEKGQAIVYLVLGLVVFLGFVALAIDGGMALSDRRHAQNSADASSLAGGAAAALHLQENEPSTCSQPWRCDEDVVNKARADAVAAAEKRAGDNINFSSNLNNLDVSTTCGLDYIDVTVDITTTTPSNFLQLVFPNALQNKVEAVTRVNPSRPSSFGNAITALNPEKCIDPGYQGVIIGGDGTLHVEGGDVFSNGCMRQNGNSITVELNNSEAKGHDLKNSEAWASLTTETILRKDYEIDPPNCDATPADHRIDGKFLPSELSPGLWCISGNVTINQAQKLHGDGVTIYMLGGNFTITGPADVVLTAPPNTSVDPYPALKGLLFYLPITPTPEVYAVTLNGNQSSYFTGLIYAPSSTVTLSGTGENEYRHSQVIGWNVIIEGTGNLWISYDPCTGYIHPPSIELYR